MLVKTFSALLAASAVVAAGALGLMVADREPPINIVESRLVTPVVRPGGSLEREITFVQHKRCHIHSDRAVFDSEGKRYLLPPLELRSGNIGPVDEEATFILSIPLPTDMAPGPARYESTAMYRCNAFHWLWPVHGPHVQVNFTVAPR